MLSIAYGPMYGNPIGYGVFARQGRCVPPLAGRGGLPGGGRARRGPAVYRNGPYGPTSGARAGAAGYPAGAVVLRGRAGAVLPGGGRGGLLPGGRYQAAGLPGGRRRGRGY